MSDRQESSGWWLASDGKWYPPESHPSAVTHTAQPTGVRYAGFWLRAAAWVIDIIIVWIGMFAAIVILGSLAGPLAIVAVAAPWLYFAVLESSARQATLGKQAVGIRVADLTDQRITFGRASGRFFGKILSVLILYIGFLMAGWTPKKQALHDMMAATLVVRN